MTTMKVLRLHNVGEVQLHDEPMPQPGPGEVLVRVRAVSVCGSDIHWFAEGGIGDVRLKKPLVLGHEFAGEIASGPRKGERVAIDPAVPCGHCEYCQEGNPNFCTTLLFAGDGKTDGGLREYVAWPEHCLFRLPDSIDYVDGAILEALGVGLHSIDLGHLRMGMSVGIFGCGPIGLMMIQLARLSGATQIIATDKLAHRLEVARKFGATQTFLAEGGRENDAVLAATNRRGGDVAFEVAGVNDAVQTAIAVAKPGARVVLVGIPPDDRVEFSASVARRKGLTIKCVRRMKHVYPRAIAMVDQGLVDIHSIATHRFPLAQAGQAFEEAERRTGLKVVIEL
jgi:L-iditol 2-dehydrogenase